MLRRSEGNWWILRYGRMVRLVLLVIPLSLGLVWGEYYESGTFHTFRFAQNLAAGRGLNFDAVLPSLSAPRSPLFIVVLALADPIMQQIGLVISALGWGAVAVVVYHVGRRVKRPLAGLIAAVLIAFSPFMLPALGSPIPWSIALGLTAVSLFSSAAENGHGRLWVRQTAVFLLLLGVYFDAGTIGLALALLGRQWWRSRRFPWPQTLAILLAILAWGGFLARWWGLSALFSPGSQLISISQSFIENELLWLTIPFLFLGIIKILGSWRRIKGNETGQALRYILTPALIWVGLAVFLRSPQAEPLTAVLAGLLVGLGVEWVIQHLSAINIVTISAHSMAVIFTAILLFAQLVTLWQAFRVRPAAQYALEIEAANWLQANSEPAEVLFASPRIGFWADRVALPAEFNRQTAAFDSGQIADLMAVAPDLIVSDRTIPWSGITSLGWFRDHYQPARKFDATYTAPITVWEQMTTLFDSGGVNSIKAVVADKIKLVGYWYGPVEIQPGDDIYLSLYLEALEPMTVGFFTEVHLTYIQDEWVWSWQRELTPRSLPGQLWQPGQTIVERFTLESEESIPNGAYKLQVLWHEADDETLWPIYRDNDVNVLDRVLLGYVGVPESVDSGQATPRLARFGDQIALNGFEIIGQAVPGSEVEFVLYWQAERPPDDNYYVFVHLIDEAGQPAAIHDSQPMNGRYATRAWQPGTTIRDSHALTLPTQLAPGTYQVFIGLYTRDTGLRLPVWEDGVEQEEGRLRLTQLVIDVEEN